MQQRDWESILSTLRPASCNKLVIFTWRGILSKLMVLPYENETISLVASMDRSKNCIFIVEQKQANPCLNDERLLLSVYGGKKFETICTLDLEEYEAMRSLRNDGNGFLSLRLQNPVDPISEFGAVIRRDFGADMILCYGAEMDCVWPESISNLGHLPLNSFIELKTINKHILKSESFLRCVDKSDIFRSRLLKFWTQTFLVDTPLVYLGHKDRNFNVVSTSFIQTTDIPSMVRANLRNPWVGFKMLPIRDPTSAFAFYTMHLRLSIENVYWICWKIRFFSHLPPYRAKKGFS